MSEMKKTTFTWTINDFDMCPHLPAQPIESPTFSIDAMKTTRFSLRLYPRGSKSYTQGEIYVSLFFMRHNDNGAHEIQLNYELCFIDVFGNRNSSAKVERSFPRNTTRGYKKFYERNLLLGTFKDRLLPENKLTVRCQIEIVNPTKDCGTTNIVQSSEVYEDLSREIGELLVSGLHSDMTIQVGEKEFKVHRAILEKRCPSLVKQLSKLEDSKTYSLALMEAPVLEVVLKYLYTGSYSGSEMLEEVFIATNIYSLADLKASLFPYPSCITATTEIDVFQAECPWVIQDFRAMKLNKELKYRLLSDEIPDWTWMKISLFKIKSETVDEYELKFRRLYKKQNIFMKCEIHVTHESKSSCISNKYEHIFENEDNWVAPMKLNMESMDKILQNGDLLLQIKIRISKESKGRESRKVLFDTVFQKISDDSIKEWITFQKDLRNLYYTMKYADLILCVGSEKLPAHKAILCSRSEIFQKMFQYDTLEKQTDTVKIEDIDVPTMTSLLMYMYCGDIAAPFCVSTAIQIYAAADKYQVLVLKQKCGQYLKTNISAENVGEILIFADTCHDEILKKCAYDFITSHPNEILNSEKYFNSLQNRDDLYPDILKMLLQHIAQNNSATLFEYTSVFNDQLD